MPRSSLLGSRGARRAPRIHPRAQARAESVLAPEMAAIVARTEHPLLQAETLAMELEPQGIGVSVLCPGWVATHITESQRN